MILICLYHLFYQILIGLEKSNCRRKKSLPYLEILSKPRILISYAAASFSAAKWYGFDPILEPELSKTVSLFSDHNLTDGYKLTNPLYDQGQSFFHTIN